jgi:hypothetical protein
MSGYINDRYCPGRARHWRIAFRTVGMRTPVCVYCGSPNPKPLSEEEWASLLDWSADNRVGRHVAEAIEEYQEARQR